MEYIKNCKDCGLPLSGKSCESGWSPIHVGTSKGVDAFVGWMEEKEHLMTCCDCFDELLGMPASSRTTPRP